jgi:hypothetical protein
MANKIHGHQKDSNQVEEIKTPEERINPEGMKDIRFYLEKGKKGFTQDTLRVETGNNTNQKEDFDPFDKMKMIKSKMIMSRKMKDRQEVQDAMIVKRKKVLPKTFKGERLFHANEVHNSRVQEELDLVVVGSDVEALYPSLTDIEVGLICFQAVMESKVQFDNVNLRKATQYIAMCLTNKEHSVSPLRRILPRRTSRGGVKPGVTSKPSNEENWKFPEVEITSRERRMVIATVIQIGVIAMMNTHVYGFDSKIYLQKAGGPIGLQSTCAVARVTMSYWDGKWLELMRHNNIIIKKSNRYMDDIRAFLKSLQEGWRWYEGGLCYTESWRLEDELAGLSSTRRTGNILIQSMNEVLPFLRFTLEIGDDFPDGKLPSLDTKVWVEWLAVQADEDYEQESLVPSSESSTGMDEADTDQAKQPDAGKEPIMRPVILFEFFEKPMSSNLVVHAKSAISEESKASSLAEEVVRRLKNTSRRCPSSRKVEVVERVAQR